MVGNFMQYIYQMLNLKASLFINLAVPLDYIMNSVCNWARVKLIYSLLVVIRPQRILISQISIPSQLNFQNP